jgi:hypothetical protein
LATNQVPVDQIAILRDQLRRLMDQNTQLHGQMDNLSAQGPFEKGDSLGVTFVIHTMDVDTTDARPHGRDRAEDEAFIRPISPMKNGNGSRR